MISVDKLILVINESCNLNCSYCYVNLAPVKKRSGRMTSTTVKKILRNFFSKYDNCTLIQFFGGEPTFNLNVIETTIEETLLLVDEGLLMSVPRFGLVTNGVFQNNNLTVELIKKYRIETTVSIDGPANIHNKLRPHISGSPTYEITLETLNNLLEAKIPMAIESVYTTVHIQENFSVIDLINFCNNLGVGKLIFDTALPPAPPYLNPLNDNSFIQCYSLYEEAVDWWFQRILSGNPNLPEVYFKDLLLPLLDGKPAVSVNASCPASSSEFAIGPNGDIFPCQLFYGYSDFRIGNIIGDGFVPSKKNFPTKFGEIPSCKICFARYWCQPCGALNYYWGNTWITPVRVCELRRTVVRRLAQWVFEYLDIQNNKITNILKEELKSHINF